MLQNATFSSSGLLLEIKNIPVAEKYSESFFLQYRAEMPPPRYVAPVPRRQPPFLGTTVKEYLDRYWAVMFSSSSVAVDAARMRHYINWYCTKYRTVDLDHHVCGRRLVLELRSIAEKNNNAVNVQLPLLFVNKKIVGGMDAILRLEEERKLKDVLQFGFEWNSGSKLCGPLPSAFGDASLFLGKYSGSPIAKPVMQLPKMHPHLVSPKDSGGSLRG